MSWITLTYSVTHNERVPPGIGRAKLIDASALVRATSAVCGPHSRGEALTVLPPAPVSLLAMPDAADIPPQAATQRTSSLLINIDVYLTWCFASETSPRASELSETLHMRPCSLTRRIKALTGFTASEYLKRAQLERAKCLIHAGVPLGRVAYCAGFGTRATFYRAFRSKAGCTPGEFRSSCKK